MSTPGSRTIRECPECKGPCSFYNPDYGSIYISGDEDYFDMAFSYEKNTLKCPHCSKDFYLPDSEITCIYFLDEYKASLLKSGMEINSFMGFLGIPTYGKTYTKYKIFQNLYGKKHNEYDAYYVAFKALPIDYFSKMRYMGL